MQTRLLAALLLTLVLLLPLGLGGLAIPTPPTSSDSALPMRGRAWRYAWGESGPFEHQTDAEEVVGLDVLLLKTVVKQQLGGRLVLADFPRGEHQQTEAIRKGLADVTTDMEGRPEQLAFARFSEPYRRVEMVVIAPAADPQGWLRRRSEVELLRDLQRSRARIGVIEGWSHGPRLEPWFRTLSRESPERLRVFNSPAALVGALGKGELELGLGERLSLATTFLNVNPSSLGQPLANAADPFRVVVSRFMFSARTVSAREVAAFNKALTSVLRSGDYQRIVRKALFPVLLEVSAGRWWFYPVELLGVFAAALTGAVLALRCGLGMVGLVIVAMVTSIGGGVMRDALINRPVPSVLQSPVYLGLVYGAIAVVLLAALLHRRLLTSVRLDPWLDGLDAVGIAAFTVTGVLIALRMQAEPLFLWGPQLSVLTACGGMLVREVVLGRGDPMLRPGILYIEIVFLCSLILSLFLTVYSGQTSYRLRDIEQAVIATMVAVIILRMAALRWQWRSPVLPGRMGRSPR